MRLLSLGFELGNPEHDLTVFSGSTISTGLVCGLFAIQIRGSLYFNQSWSKTIPALSELYWAQHFKADSLAFGLNSYMLAWYYGATLLGSIRMDPATNLWKAYVGVNQIASSAAPNVVVVNTWYRMDVRVKIADANADPTLTGRIQLWIDGLLVIDFSGDTKPGADTTINVIAGVQNGPDMWTNTYYCYDNLMLNDTTGPAPDNGRIGEGRIIALIPNADGTYSQWKIGRAHV